jgi:hypothetical protein
MEIFFVLIFIILFSSFIFFHFYKIKSSIRNNIREGNVADIQKALLFYYNNTNKYPVSEGECMDEDSPVVKKLKNEDIINEIPYDPEHPSAKPLLVKSKSIPDPNAKNFCFWYTSNGKTYKIYYYTEPSSISPKGNVVHVTEGFIGK